MKLILVARKALQAYLIISAEATSVVSTGQSTPLYSAATCSATAGSSAPITTRSACMKSSMAVPSRRNSGLEA